MNLLDALLHANIVTFAAVVRGNSNGTIRHGIYNTISLSYQDRVQIDSPIGLSAMNETIVQIFDAFSELLNQLQNTKFNLASRMGG
jgi:hypothetical protein